MKLKSAFLGLTALYPLLSFALISPEAIELARLEQEAAQLRQALGGCSVTQVEDSVKGLKALKNKNDKEALVAYNNVENDLLFLKEDCFTARTAVRLLAIQSQSISVAQKLGIYNDLPSSAAEFNTAQDEKDLEEKSERTVKALDHESCQLDELPYDQLSWHAFFLQNGYRCTAKAYSLISNIKNADNSRPNAQRNFNDLEKMDLSELKEVFVSEFNEEIAANKLKIAFVPQLSYENGMLSGVFPYNLFIKETEKTGYSFLKKELSHLGAKVEIIYRNSLASMSEQVEQTEAELAKLDGPHLVISRSMGSRVMHEIKKRHEQDLAEGLGNVAAWFNVGGTPNGSVIADYKARPDLFYRGVFPQVSDTLKLPLNLIAKDPRVVDHIAQTIYSALDRQNLMTMAHHADLNPSSDESSALKVYNLVFLPPAYDRATQGVDPVYTHMLSYGPTEGSSPLAGAAVDTMNSVRVLYNLDHLAFWKLSPQEGLALYLRTLIAAKREGLAF
ncbi:MAG: hypothetical protein K2P81_09915 [Bacteriovoracaceae bacterium]|nr:hypothetical protein [Bacteriovoracaceae bacterium]